MASTAQTELQKLYKDSTKQYDDEKLESLVRSIERVMRRPAGLLLAQAGLDSSVKTPFMLLDNACGTGPIAAHLQQVVDKDVLSQSKILCADINEGNVEILKKRVAKYKWTSVETAVLDAQKSGFPDQSYSHVSINFAMHIVPEPQIVVQDTMRILKPGGVFAFTVWHKDNKGWVPDTRTAFESLPFEAPMPDPLPMAVHGKLEWTDPEGIAKELASAGFEDIETKTMDHIQHIEGAEDFVASFSMIKDWMINTYWSEQSQQQGRGMVDDHVVKHLKQKHGGQGWDVTWTFISVTCRKPSV